MYFVINNSDGDTIVQAVDEGTLKKRLAEKYYGLGVTFLEGHDLALNSDTNYWGDNVLIIKGEICIPKPVRVVTDYEI